MKINGLVYKLLNRIRVRGCPSSVAVSIYGYITVVDTLNSKFGIPKSFQPDDKNTGNNAHLPGYNATQLVTLLE